MILMGVSEVIALGALLVALVTLLINRNRDSSKDTKEATTAQVQTMVKLDGIANGVDDIRVEQRAMRERVDKLAERTAGVEQSTKSAHHRLDELETRFNAAHPPSA